MAGVSTPGLPIAGTVSYPALTGYELCAFDTYTPQGVSPQSVAISAFQIAAFASAMSVAANTQTSTVGAATLSTLTGRIITENLTTAAGANYTMTLTNTLITAASVMQVAVASLTNTIPGLSVLSVTPAAGSAVILIHNGGTAALNGNILITFQVRSQ